MKEGLSKRMCGQLAGCLALVVAFSGGSASAATGPLAASSAVGPAAIGEAQLSGSFVGKVEGALIGVAVVAERSAARGQARTISVYVCNGSSLSAWLTGQTPGNEVTLQSTTVPGLVVQVRVEAQRARGGIVLPTGRRFVFTALPARGVAGLYDVTVAADGAVRGASATGASLTGRVGFGGKLLSYAPVVATASAGGQEDVKLTAFARRARPGAYRWIVLPARIVYGANRRGPRLGGVGAQLVRPTGGKKVRIEAGSTGQPGYDDKECQRLANQYNTLSEIFVNATVNGNGATAASALSAATATAAELDDHCFVIE